MAIETGHCRRCGEIDTERRYGRCMNVSGSIHDWVEIDVDRPPVIEDFLQGVKTEAEFQVRCWGVNHDAGKAHSDWFWLLGYLAGKALTAAIKGDRDKALHHTISTAAACFNWHQAIKGADNRMRPGIEPPKE